MAGVIARRRWTSGRRKPRPIRHVGSSTSVVVRAQEGSHDVHALAADAARGELPTPEVPGRHRTVSGRRRTQDDRRAGQDVVPEQTDEVEVRIDHPRGVLYL